MNEMFFFYSVMFIKKAIKHKILFKMSHGWKELSNDFRNSNRRNELFKTSTGWRVYTSTALHLHQYRSNLEIYPVIYTKGLVAFKWPPSSKHRNQSWPLILSEMQPANLVRKSTVPNGKIPLRFYGSSYCVYVCTYMKFRVYTRWACIGNREWKGWKNILRRDIFSKIMSSEFWEGQVMESFVFYY